MSAGLDVSVSVGLGLVMAIALWCQLHLAALFESSDKFRALRGQGDREREFLARYRPGGGCPYCCMGSTGWTAGDPCPHCGVPMLTNDEAVRRAQELGHV